MIQRVQNLYLFLIIVFNIIYTILNIKGFVFFPSFSLFNFVTIYFYLIPLFSLTILSLIFYKRRNKQLFFNKINLMFNFALLLLFLIDSLILFDFFYLIFIFNLLLLIISNKAIKKDEDLINSIDRIR